MTSGHMMSVSSLCCYDNMTHSYRFVLSTVFAQFSMHHFHSHQTAVLFTPHQPFVSAHLSAPRGAGGVRPASGCLRSDTGSTHFSSMTQVQAVDRAAEVTVPTCGATAFCVEDAPPTQTTPPPGFSSLLPSGAADSSQIFSVLDTWEEGDTWLSLSYVRLNSSHVPL